MLLLYRNPIVAVVPSPVWKKRLNWPLKQPQILRYAQDDSAWEGRGTAAGLGQLVCVPDSSPWRSVACAADAGFETTPQRLKPPSFRGIERHE
jgi:hypothetical protein